ncbi:hypothetical protein AURDEDRAFT_125550 [Auricularia subglabra TFB-10046 SS5]|nr:hypothetical protein AURDEDRAFT_125550 [Auricularia subglabra TFB-10046 SS5]
MSNPPTPERERHIAHPGNVRVKQESDDDDHGLGLSRKSVPGTAQERLLMPIPARGAQAASAQPTPNPAPEETRAEQELREGKRPVGLMTFGEYVVFTGAYELYRTGAFWANSLKKETPPSPQGTLAPVLEQDDEAHSLHQHGDDVDDAGDDESADDGTDSPPAYNAPAPQVYGSDRSLTPTPPPRQVRNLKRERDENDDDATGVAPAAKHPRVQTDAAAGSPQRAGAYANSRAASTRDTESTYTTAVLAAVGDSEDDSERPGKGDVDKKRPATPPMRSVRGRKPTPHPTCSIIPVPRTVTVEFELGRDSVKVKQEQEDDVQLLLVRHPIKLDADAGATDAGDASPASLPAPDAAQQRRGYKTQGGRTAKGGRQGKNTKRERSGQ